MDRALDDIVRERQYNRIRRQRKPAPGGVKKHPSSNKRIDKRRSVAKRAADFDTRADKRTPYNKNTSNRRTSNRNGRNDETRNPRPSTGYKLKITNLHHEVDQDELLALFRHYGVVEDFQMIYDRFDRIEGTCFVTYKHESDALDAIRANDGAVAMGQAITVAFVQPPPPRSLFERINFPQTGNKGTPRSVEPEKKEHNKRHRQRNRKNRNGNKTTKENPAGMKPQEVFGEMEVEMKDCVQEENALVQVKLHDTTMAEDEEYNLIL